MATPTSQPDDNQRLAGKTLDGDRVKVSELNTDVPFTSQAQDSAAPAGRLRRWWRNFNLVLAGMYTGLTCYGTPHSQRHGKSSARSSKDAEDPGQHADKPDNRPI